MTITIATERTEDLDHTCQRELQTLCHEFWWQRLPDAWQFSNHEVVDSPVVFRQNANFGSDPLGQGSNLPSSDHWRKPDHESPHAHVQPVLHGAPASLLDIRHFERR